MNEEDITKIAPTPAYLLYDVFKKDLDAAMVYERLPDSTEVSDMYTFANIYMLVHDRSMETQ